MADLKSLKLTTATDSGYVTSAGATDAQAANIMLNALKIATGNSLAVFGMIDGVIDDFQDSTGIDTAKSSTSATNSGGYMNAITAGGAVTQTDATTAAASIGPGGTIANLVVAAGSWDAQDNPANHQNNDVRFDMGASKFVSDIRVKANWSPTTVNFTFWGTNDTGTNMMTHGSAETSASWEEIDSVKTATWNSTGTFATTTFTEVKSFRYWKFIITSSHTGSSSDMTHVTFGAQAANTNSDMVLVSASQTADASPDTAALHLIEQDVAATTINTDVKAHVTRDAGRTFTTDYGTDEKCDISAHTMANGTRVTVSSSTTLPAGLSTGVLYFVVNGTTNDFELSLTSGGSAVNITDDGTGTHTLIEWVSATLVDQGDSATNQQIWSDTNIDLSGLPAGTAMRYCIETLNTKALKIHGTALQWS